MNRPRDGSERNQMTDDQMRELMKSQVKELSLSVENSLLKLEVRIGESISAILKEHKEERPCKDVDFKDIASKDDFRVVAGSVEKLSDSVSFLNPIFVLKLVTVVSLATALIDYMGGARNVLSSLF